MTIEKGYRKRYESGNIPWDTGRADFNLIETVAGFPVPSCKALDIGCGTGDNSIWLAQKGFEIRGTDVSDIAVEKAREKAAAADAKCDFAVADFFKTEIAGGPFGFIFDRGCFHSFVTGDDRDRFARKAAAHLEESGLWLTLAGNADENRHGPGPPQRTAGEIVSAVEPYFEILLLQSSRFGSNRPNPPRAWKCLLRKRREAYS